MRARSGRKGERGETRRESGEEAVNTKEEEEGNKESLTGSQ